MLNRLMGKSSTYNVTKWETDRRQQVQDVKRICKYDINKFSLALKKKRKSKSRDAEAHKYKFETYYNHMGVRAFRPPAYED